MPQSLDQEQTLALARLVAALPRQMVPAPSVCWHQQRRPRARVSGDQWTLVSYAVAEVAATCQTPHAQELHFLFEAR